MWNWRNRGQKREQKRGNRPWERGITIGEVLGQKQKPADEPELSDFHYDPKPGVADLHIILKERGMKFYKKYSSPFVKIKLDRPVELVRFLEAIEGLRGFLSSLDWGEEGSELPTDPAGEIKSLKQGRLEKLYLVPEGAGYKRVILTLKSQGGSKYVLSPLSKSGRPAGIKLGKEEFQGLLTLIKNLNITPPSNLKFTVREPNPDYVLRNRLEVVLPSNVKVEKPPVEKI